MKFETPGWVEGIATQVEQDRQPPYIVKGGISPSGPIHVGHLNEILRPYFVAQELRQRGYEVTQYLTIDDMDSLESIPDSAFVKENDLGSTLVEAKIITPSGSSSFADVYVRSIESILDSLGLAKDVELRRASQDYQENYDDYVRLAIDRKEEIQSIMENYQKTEYTVHNGVKLGWRVEWAVQWALLDVDFEPFGKDHAESSYASACDVAREIFEIDPPVPLEYEWFTIEGEAMSSSSGIGITASDLIYYIGTDAAMYMYTMNPRKQREIQMKRIYQIVNEYDNSVNYEGPSYREAASFWLGSEKSSSRLLSYSDYNMEHMDRIINAGQWATMYSKKDDYTIIDPSERDPPTRIVEHILVDAHHIRDAQQIQNLIYEWVEYFNRDTGDVFRELYQHLLGRDDGPRAGRLLASMDVKNI